MIVSVQGPKDNFSKKIPGSSVHLFARWSRASLRPSLGHQLDERWSSPASLLWLLLGPTNLRSSKMGYQNRPKECFLP